LDNVSDCSDPIDSTLVRNATLEDGTSYTYSVAERICEYQLPSNVAEITAVLVSSGGGGAGSTSTNSKRVTLTQKGTDAVSINHSGTGLIQNTEDETKISMKGYGFSASGFDNSFIFTGEVSGEITTKD